MPRPARHFFLLLALAVCASGCDDLLGPGHELVVSGAEQSDTVFATLPAPLVLQVRRDGKPAPGVRVSLGSAGQSRGPHVAFRYLGRDLAQTFEELTDEDGRISVGVVLKGP